MRNKRNAKEEQGITLMALIITIIVLVILAAISISAAYSSGMIKFAAQEAKEYAQAAIDENKIMEETAEYIDSVASNIKSLFAAPQIPKTASDIAKEPSMFGQKVEYEGGEAGANYDWQIFYADESNIYLIASDYIEYNDAPLGKGNNKLDINDGSESDGKQHYQLSMGTVINGYSGSSDITNEKIQSLNSSYFTSGYSSSYPNMKAVAYMLDTEAWNKKFGGDKAEFAIGGPTLELLFKSYNKKYNSGNEVYQAKAINNYGYEISCDSGINWYTYIKGENNYLNKEDSNYVMQGAPFGWGMWIASPCGPEETGKRFVFRLDAGNVNWWSLGGDYGFFRPIVCLKTDVKLVEEDGNLVVK